MYLADSVLSVLVNWTKQHCSAQTSQVSGVDSGGARIPPEFEGSEKGQSLISALRSLAITASTHGFEKLSTALQAGIKCTEAKEKLIAYCPKIYHVSRSTCHLKRNLT